MHPSRLKTIASRLVLVLTSLFVCQCADPAGSMPAAGSAPAVRGASNRILVIGDSLSVGSFGDTMESFLTSKAGARQFYYYASCGSSLQHWLSSTPAHVTTCGYRETRPGAHILLKHKNGRRPPPMTTPKLERLLRQIRPSTVIVQLGTNHFDEFRRHGSSIMDEQRRIFEEFATALTSGPGRPSQVIWVTPPDSAKFSPSIESTVEKLILETCRRHRFMPVRSQALTKYVRGVTGGDGVHYAEKPGQDWAARVIRVIRHRF